MSFLDKIEQGVRKRKDKARPPLSSIARSHNSHTFKNEINKSKNKTKVNLSNLMKLKSPVATNEDLDADKENRSVINDKVTSDASYSLLDITKKSKSIIRRNSPVIPSGNFETANDQQHLSNLLSSHRFFANNSSVSDTRNNLKGKERDIVRELSTNDPMLQDKDSLLSQAVTEHKSAMNWFEATNYKYIWKHGQHTSDSELYNVERISKLSDFSYIVEVSLNGTVSEVLLNKMRNNQTTESLVFDDLQVLVNKKIILGRKNGELQVDEKGAKLDCYSKWHILY